MSRYRYRTPVLVGPWRATAQEAIGDAIASGQAIGASDDPESINWLDGAHLEVEVSNPTFSSFFENS